MTAPPQRRRRHRAQLLAGRLLAAVAFLTLALPAAAERIKDLAQVAGVRGNPLVGYGLVVGLDGTGDQTSQAPFTTQSLKSMLAQFGVVVPPNVNPQLKNVAAVSVHTELPPFARTGQAIDVTVSSLGNAKSLRGGTLLMTPLKGADGQVYALAQGNLVVGGFGAAANDGSRITVNVPSSGRIPNGAQVERTVPSPFAQGDSITLQLHRPDFTTASRMVAAINSAFGPNTAAAVDGSSLNVRAPAEQAARVNFVATLENVTLDPGEAPARVVINSRTGTVVVSRHVRVLPAAVSHGSLTVTIKAQTAVSQPPALSGGATVATPTAQIDIKEENRRMFVLDAGVSLDDLVRAVNQIGIAPGDLVAILSALKEAGALRAELVII